MKIGIIAIMAFLVMMLATVASAVTLNTPAASGTISGSAYVLNATTTLVNGRNCTFTALSASTANSSAVTLGTYTNTSAGQLTNYTIVFDSTILEDAATYQFTALCYNSSGDSETVTNTGVVIDNTVPTSISSSPADEAEIGGTSTFTGTIIDANTTGTVYLYIGNNVFAMTCTGSACTYTTTETDPAAGNYDWYIYSSDGTNTSSSTSREVSIDTSSGNNQALTSAVVEQTQQEQEQAEQATTTRNLIIIVALIVWGDWYFGFRKKK